MPRLKIKNLFRCIIKMNNKSCLGFYSGFSLFSIQIIVEEYYRDCRQKQHDNKIKSFLSSIEKYKYLHN